MTHVFEIKYSISIKAYLILILKLIALISENLCYHSASHVITGIKNLDIDSLAISTSISVAYTLQKLYGKSANVGTYESMLGLML